VTLSRVWLAEKAGSVERHLDRVSRRLPDDASERFEPGTDASDAVVLHLWQATQLVLDVALSAAIDVGGSAPRSYGEAFRVLERHDVLAPDLAERLVAAAGFRNVIVHAYEELDMQRVLAAARRGPADLRAFLAAVRDYLPPA